MVLKSNQSNGIVILERLVTDESIFEFINTNKFNKLVLGEECSIFKLCYLISFTFSKFFKTYIYPSYSQSIKLDTLETYS